jgi:hypothetical protein
MNNKNSDVSSEVIKLNHRNWIQYQEFMLLQIIPKFDLAGEEILKDKQIQFEELKPLPSADYYNLKPSRLNQELADAYIQDFLKDNETINHNSNSNVEVSSNVLNNNDVSTHNNRDLNVIDNNVSNNNNNNRANDLTSATDAILNNIDLQNLDNFDNNQVFEVDNINNREVSVNVDSNSFIKFDQC